MWKYTRKLFKKLWKTENVVVMIQFFVIFLREIAVSRVKSVYNDAEMRFYSTRRV